MSPTQQAAQRLFQAHAGRERFAPLPPELAPRTEDEAYAIQDAFVALRAKERGPVVGHKIALSSAEMRRFVGVERPQAGVIFKSTLRRSPARVRAIDYVHLIVEFEVAVEMAEDLPAADAPFSRARVAEAVGAVMPALEIADDRDADYSRLAQHPLHLIADNTWNEGAVLGAPLADWRALDLAALIGRASVNGEKVGEGPAAAAMGHPFDATAWIAGHLARRGHGLLRGDVVITGSLITSKAVKAGDRVSFSLGAAAKAELAVT